MNTPNAAPGRAKYMKCPLCHGEGVRSLGFGMQHCDNCNGVGHVTNPHLTAADASEMVLVPREYTDAQLAGGIAQLQAVRNALGEHASDETICGVIYDGMVAARNYPDESALTAAVNDRTSGRVTEAMVDAALEVMSRDPCISPDGSLCSDFVKAALEAALSHAAVTVAGGERVGFRTTYNGCDAFVYNEEVSTLLQELREDVSPERKRVIVQDVLTRLRNPNPVLHAGTPKSVPADPVAEAQELSDMAADVLDRFHWMLSPDAKGNHTVKDLSVKAVIRLCEHILNRARTAATRGGEE